MTLADRALTTRFPGRTAGRRARDQAARPAWYRPALLALLAATALLYLWDLSASGNANSFYAAAVQAGSKSWKAWFFGSLDSSNFITVDKPPGALWVMGLSARLFGYNSWSLLVPQALEGIAAVGLLAAAVRRVAGPAAGLIAGAVLALTPAAVLIFRFDNPDAFLVLLLVAAAYSVTRALEAGRTRWLVLAGAALGFAFLTKSGQALLPVPALGLAYLVAAPVSLRRRIGQLLLAGLAMVIAAGWWIVAVLAWPAADRPYIGGSTDNNPLQLAFGYNGLDRLFGGSGNSGGGGGGGRAVGGTSFGGATGLERLFRGEFGLEISWLLPAALLLLAAGVWLTWRSRREDPVRAALIVWGGWLLVTAATFSFMKGTIHPYYTVALAPAIAALVGIGGATLWQRRGELGRAAWAALALVVAVTGAWDVALLRSQSSFHPSVTVIAIVISVLAIAGLVVAARRTTAGRRAATVAGITAVLALAVPVASWGVATASTAHSGSVPTAVETSNSAGFGGGGAPGFGGVVPGGLAGGTTGRGTTSGRAPTGTKASAGQPGGGAPGGTKPSGIKGSGTKPTGTKPSGTKPTGTKPGGTRASGTKPSGTKPGGTGASGTRASGTKAGGLRSVGKAGAEGRPDGSPGGFGGFGGFGGGSQSASSALKTALEKTTTRWAAATDGSQSAATLELATGGKAVMAIGGFTGSDPAPTLAQFKAYVAAGDITYYIAGSSGGGPGGGSGSASGITSWVEAHYKATTIGGQTVYVLHR
jgi:4-amino-4-deoxy-L-arabinose transferase-like glycosyltransferase